MFSFPLSLKPFTKGSPTFVFLAVVVACCFWPKIRAEEEQKCIPFSYEEDISFLTEELKKDTCNTQYMLHLAGAYMNEKKYDAALHWYKTIVESNEAPFEKKWYSQYMIGQIYAKKNLPDQALAAYFRAFFMNTARREPLIRIAQHYCDTQKYALSYIFAQQAKTIPPPPKTSLFIEEDAYTYLPDTLISIAGYYTEDGTKEGLNACDQLILQKNIPERIRTRAYSNMQFYTKPLEGLKKYPLIIPLPEITPGSGFFYHSMNPTIHRTTDGYIAIIRTVNYYLDNKKGLLHTDPNHKTVDTKNFIVTLTKDFKTISSKELTETLDRKKYPFHATGLEDCRFFSITPEEKPTWCTCVTLDTNPNKASQVSLIHFIEQESRYTVDKLIPIASPQNNPKRWEKNWLPFIKDGLPHVIYNYDPLLIYTIQPETNVLTKVNESTPTANCSNFRGSGGPVPFEKGYLILVHEILKHSYTQRLYAHRFVYVDKDFKICKMSHPFTFSHMGTEFSCGMTLDHENTHLVIGIGIEDAEAYVGVIDVKTVSAMLFDQT